MGSLKRRPTVGFFLRTIRVFYRGHLKFEGPDGTTFEVKIPAFSLDSKYSVDPDTGDIGPPDEA